MRWLDLGVLGTYGTLTLNPDGTYSYTLTGAVTDTTGNDGINTVLSAETFTYLATDANGNTVQGTITIDINDDVPVARDEQPVVLTEGGPISFVEGNVLDNDTFGADQPISDVTWDSAFDGNDLSVYGDLLQNSDGTWSFTLNNDLAATQALKEGESKTATYTYSFTDADGDLASAKLTITINGSNDRPGITTDSGNPDGTNDLVYEAGLPDIGSRVGPTTTTVTGTFTLSDADGLDDIASVTINGQLFAIGDLQGSTINGAAGIFTITTYDPTTGVAVYSYTLTKATTDVPGETETDVFTLFTTDQGGLTSADATVTIEIVDDVPVARDEQPVVLTEDGPISFVEGNVLDNDTFGADQPISDVTWDSAFDGNDLSVYGDLLQNSDGTWSFTLNNDLAATQALKEGESKTATYTYSFTDADGDLASAKLTITINGSNDRPGITTDSGNPDGTNDLVYEAGLPDIGSRVGPTTTTVTGTFTLSDADGLDDIASVTINGQLFAIGDLQGSIINGAAGIFTITTYDPTTGVAVYSYTLTKATTDVPGETETDVFTLFTTDQGGLTSADATVTIEIVDDVPVARDEQPVVLTEDGPISFVEGNVLDNDTFGADQPISDVTWDSAFDGNDLSVYGDLLQNSDGTWSFTLNNDLAATQALKEGESKTATYTYSFTDADGDLASAKLTITINGSNDRPGITTDSGNPDGTNDLVYEAGLPDIGSRVGPTTTTVTGTFTLSDADGLDDIASVTINGQLFAIGDLQGSTINGAAGIFTITTYDPTTGVAVYSYTLTQATTDVPGETETDVFTLFTTDQGGLTSADATVTIEIVDDVPVARDEQPVVLTEDGPISFVEGNVLDNDTFGADQPISDVTWDSAFDGNDLSVYGDLLQNSDGTWSFTLNNDLAATQALKEGESKTATYTYSFTDADGDLASAKLTITINGSNDRPGITTDSGNPDGTNDLVYEAGLPDIGSRVGPTTTTVTGTFTLSDADGLDDIASVTINGQLFAIGDLQGSIINGAAGIFTITTYDPTTGVAVYSYTLTKATTDVPGETETDVFTLFTTDQGGLTSADATVTIEIVDDVPTVADAENLSLLIQYDENGDILPGSLTVEGSLVDLVPGADRPSSFELLLQNEEELGLVSTSQIIDGNTLHSYSLKADSEATVLFTVTVDNNTGDYQFELLDPSASISQTVFLGGKLTGNKAVPSFDFGPITIYADGNNSGIQSAAAGLAGDANSIKVGDGFRFNFEGEILNGEFTLNLKNEGNSDSAKFEFLLNGKVVSSIDFLNFTAEALSAGSGGRNYDEVRVTFTNVQGDMKIIDVSFGRLVIPDGQSFTFEMSIIDSDGDAAVPVDFTVDIKYEVAIELNTIEPIAIDLDGDGSVSYLSTDAGVTFDFGWGLVATAWVAASDGLLVFDYDSSIYAATEDGLQPTAENIVLTLWAEEAATDMEALALFFDSNGDGIFDAADEHWSSFGVWQDLNGDGLIDIGEFQTLSYYEIVGFELGYIEGSEAFLAADGGVEVFGQFTVLYDDGSTGIADDFAFLVEPDQEPLAEFDAVEADVVVLIEEFLAEEAEGSDGDAFSSDVAIEDSALASEEVFEVAEMVDQLLADSAISDDTLSEYQQELEHAIDDSLADVSFDLTIESPVDAIVALDAAALELPDAATDGIDTAFDVVDDSSYTI
jgi:VCBS repeat-containing protein